MTEGTRFLGYPPTWADNIAVTRFLRFLKRGMK